MDKKNDWIKALVPGKTFIDIGGLWGTVNEKVSVALRAGAASATMADIQIQGHQLWKDAEAHCAKLGVSGYRTVTVDITEPNPETVIGIHDIVHCSGIIYHLPDPFQLLLNLKRVTGDRLILTSMVVPERVRNAAGKLDLGPDFAYFVPRLSPRVKAVLGAHFSAYNIHIAMINAPLNEPLLLPDTGKPNFGPWWWVYSPAYFKNLVETAGFSIEDECWTWEGRAYSVLVRKAV